ncbi:MAG: 30S ribosomal protein S14 [Gammaproteobacteria bacterium AqS3]|nr:30S ribosomal protein S14 [Gammaproteobacteria bacterium AqS3]
MAKKSIIEREKKRQRLVARHATRRAEIQKVLRDPDATEEERWTARMKLQKLPRNSSPVRLQNRCQLTGRPHAYLRRFGLGRNKMREHASQGHIPGVVRSSW